jgi:hypothetical protein
MRGHGMTRRLAVVGRGLQECRWAEVARLWAQPESPGRDARMFGTITAATIYHLRHGGTLREALDRLPADLAELVALELAKGLDPEGAAEPGAAGVGSP